MKVKELKEDLSHYNDDAEVEIYLKSAASYFNSGLYDMWIEGNKDENYEHFGKKPNKESDRVYFVCIEMK